MAQDERREEMQSILCGQRGRLVVVVVVVVFGPSHGGLWFRLLTVDPSGGDVLNTRERDVSPREANPG